jgi:hypothetical protein
MTNFDFSKSEQYTLSIRLSADGFSFSIHHSPDNGDIHFTEYPIKESYSFTANIKEMIASSEALGHSYHQTNILIDTHRVTPVPFELFEDEQSENLFHQAFYEGSNEIILCNILGKSNVALLFGMDKHAHQLLNEHFPNARFFACVSPMMEYFTQKSRENSHRNLYAHFQDHVFEVFAFDDGNLQLLNAFQCKQTPDKVYYLLSIWKQLGFDQEKDQLWIAGNTEEKEELLKELNRFLRKVNVITMQEKLPFDLQTLMICE